MKSLAHPQWRWLVLAFVLRLGFALKLGDNLYQVDEHGFDVPAWNWAQTGLFGVAGKPLILPPIPSGFFALVYWICGHHPLAARLGQAILGTIFVGLMGRFVKDLTGSDKSGERAMIVSAIYPFFIYYGGMLMSETLYLLASTAGLWWLCLSLREQEGSLKVSALAGAALGLAGLCRTEGVVVCGVIFLAYAGYAAFVERSRGRAMAVAMLFWVLPLLGWAARNKQQGGHWSLDEHGGTSLLHGTVVFDQNEIDTSNAMEALHAMRFWREGQLLEEDKRERLYLSESLRFMREHPIITFHQWRRKFINFWRFYPRADKPYQKIQGNNPAAGVGRWMLVAISLLFEPALILGGLWGLWLLRWRWAELFPLGIFIVSTNILHVLSVSQMRYRLPVMPALMLGACWLLAWEAKPAKNA